MRKLLYGALFLFLTLLFLYLTFPVERFVERELCSRGISYSPPVKVRRLPLPEVRLYGLKVPGLPFELPYAVLKPSPLILFKGDAPIEFEVAACGGRAEGWFTYPLKELSYHLCAVGLGMCAGSPAISGDLSSSGTLSFRGRDLVKGVGEFSVDGLTLKNLSFGLFSPGEVTFKKVKGTYEVKDRNRIEVEAEGHGEEGEFRVKGEVSYNPERPLSSYCSFKIGVRLEKEPFNGKEFNFTVRGNLKELRF